MTESPIAVTLALGMGVSVVFGAECAGSGTVAAVAAEVSSEPRGAVAVVVVVVIAMFAGFAGNPGGRGAGCATARPIPSRAVVTTARAPANARRAHTRRRCNM